MVLPRLDKAETRHEDSKNKRTAQCAVSSMSVRPGHEWKNTSAMKRQKTASNPHRFPMAINRMRFMSVKHAEEPEGDFVAKSDFNVTLYDKTVWNVLYLVEALAFATDFKEIFPVHKEIALFWVG